MTHSEVNASGYLFLLNSVIVVGTLAALGLPTLVQRLSARLEGDQIGAGIRATILRAVNGEDAIGLDLARAQVLETFNWTASAQVLLEAIHA